MKQVRAWILEPALLLVGCVTLVKLLNLSVLPFHSL